MAPEVELARFGSRATAEYIKAGLHALARQLMQTRARPQELAELAAQLVWSGLRGRS